MTLNTANRTPMMVKSALQNKVLTANCLVLCNLTSNSAGATEGAPGGGGVSPTPLSGWDMFATRGPGGKWGGHEGTPTRDAMELLSCACLCVLVSTVLEKKTVGC